MVAEALNQKEGLILELEKELALEKARREQMNKRFESQMKEFADEQRAVENIRVANRQMENGQRDKSLEAKRLVKDNEYDMVPTRLKPVSATANGITFSTQLERKQPKEARIPAAASVGKKYSGTFDPSRVKSSIPSASSTTSKTLSSYNNKHRKGKQSAVSYVEELKRVETERAVKIEQE